MKKVLKLIRAGVLVSALCVGGVACNDNGGQKSNIPKVIGMTTPLPASEEVTTFFNRHLPTISGPRSDVFFVNDDDNKCLAINSTGELKKIMHSNVELPAIDFNSNTLIIGQQTMMTTSFSVFDQSLDIESKKISLNLIVKIPEGSYSALSKLYHWGLYPKLPKTKIHVNVIYKE